MANAKFSLGDRVILSRVVHPDHRGKIGTVVGSVGGCPEVLIDGPEDPANPLKNHYIPMPENIDHATESVETRKG